MGARPSASKLAEENRRLAAELAEAQDILRALRKGEVDALVGSDSDSIYAVQLIALAVDKAETYIDALALLMGRVCEAIGGDYCEAWAVGPNRRSLRRTPAWCGTGADAVRVHEAMTEAPADPPAPLLEVFRSGKPQWLAIESMEGAYAETMRNCGLQSGLVLPLVVDERVLAVLTLWNQEQCNPDEQIIERSRRILDEAGRFVLRKLEQEGNQEMLQALRGVVHDRSRRLAELSTELEWKKRKYDEAEERLNTSQHARLITERALHQQTVLLQAVFDDMMDGVIVTDPLGTVLQFNPAAKSLLGKAPADTPLERWPEFYGLYRAQNGALLRASEMPLAKAVRGEKTARMEIFVRNEACREGRILEVSASPVHDAESSISYGAVSLLHDVTEQRHGESARRRSLVEQRDALVRQVHHNVKNSLAGATALVQQHAREHPELKSLAQNVEAQLSTIAAMHGIEALGGRGIELGNLVRSLNSNVHSLFGTSVKMDRVDDGVWRLRLQEAESVPLALALNELLVNACKHGSNGSLEFSAARDGEELVITISNSAGQNARPPFDAAAGGNGNGSGGLGISLVRALLPHDRAHLHYQQSGTRVEAILRLASDVFQPAA
jgi:two-component sensor histidine kinase